MGLKPVLLGHVKHRPGDNPYSAPNINRTSALERTVQKRTGRLHQFPARHA